MNKIRFLILAPFRFIRICFETLLIYCPGSLGVRLRRCFYPKRFKSFGEDVIIANGVTFSNPHMISIGDNTRINIGVQIAAGLPEEGDGKEFRIIRGKNMKNEGHIIIGKGVHLAPYCTILGFGGLRIGDRVSIASRVGIYTHSQVSKIPNILFSKSLDIEDDVLIGTNSSLIGVEHVAKGTVIPPHTPMVEFFNKKK